MNRLMPVSLNVVTSFQVTDTNGRILRAENVPAGAELHDRLRLAHRDYQLLGWTVDPLLPGRWSFFAEKPGRRIRIKILSPGPEMISPTSAVVSR